MSRPNAKRAALELVRANTNLTRAIVSGAIFLAFCYFIWNHFYRKADPCVQLSDNICDVAKATIPSCIEFSKQESWLQKCDDVEEGNSMCEAVKARVVKAKEECEDALSQNQSCSMARKTLAIDRRASNRSCTHALDTMRGLLNR